MELSGSRGHLHLAKSQQTIQLAHHWLGRMACGAVISPTASSWTTILVFMGGAS
jgi:hypothetical protein